LNQYPQDKFTKVVSKITNNDYSLLQTIAKQYHYKYHEIRQPIISEILRYLIRGCINANFPQPEQRQIQAPPIANNQFPSYEDLLGQLNQLTTLNFNTNIG
jgi:hypothetical protein